MKINSGIYMFRNKLNDKVYIGQSKYLNTRYRQHKCELLKGIHHNLYFQHEVTKYGFDNFEYSIVKKCPVDELDYWEDFYFKYYNSQNKKYGYNLKDAGNNSNLPTEVKIKIGLANRGKNCKLQPCDVEAIKLKRLSGCSCIELAHEYHVTKSTISKITTCKNWKYIRDDLNQSLIDLHENERIKLESDIKALYTSGLRPEQIRRNLNISVSVVNRVLSNELIKEQETKNLVISDFMSMKKVNDILSNRNISYAQYKRITKGLKPKRDLFIYNRIQELKREGMLIKDIAHTLNLNRCTINEICKRHSNHANTEVI